MIWLRQYVGLSLILVLGGIPFSVRGDDEIKNIGIPFISNYSPKEFNFGRQIWDIDINGNGLVYFADGKLLVAGNKYWKTHDPGEGRSLRCIHACSEDSILVGGSHEIGLYVVGKMPGEMNYLSIMDKLDSNYHDFGTVWQIEDYKGTKYLRAGSAVFKFSNDTIVPLIYTKFVEYMGFVNDTMFVQIADKGLGTFTNGTFTLLPFGDFFAEIKVCGVFSLEYSQLLIFTDDRGIFVVRNKRLHPFVAGFLEKIAEDRISVVRMISHKYFAIGTVKNGVFIMNTRGDLIQHINKNVGLQNNTVISMLPDESNNLWVGLDNGISFIELNSCLSKLNSESDIGTGYVSAFFDGNLYLGTNQGLFYTHWDQKDMSKNRTLNIQPVKNTSGQVWCLFVAEGRLYCGHHKGVYLVEKDAAWLIDQMEGCWKLDSLVNMPGVYLESTYRGFFILRSDRKRVLRMDRKLTGLPYYARTFLQDDQGDIWMVTAENRIFRFRIDPVLLTVRQFEEFTHKPGMPSYENIKMVGSRKRVFFSTDSGLYHYRYEYGRFLNNEYYNQMVGISKICYEFFEDNYDRIWYVNADEVGYFSLHFGKPEKTYLPFTRLYDSYTRVFGSICILDKDNILFGVDEGFYHYKSSCWEYQEQNHKVFITRIESPEKPHAWTGGSAGSLSVPVYLHKQNAFSISYTSNIYLDRDNVYYRYKLEGQDENWSEWTRRVMKEYNNLMEGEYTFRVIARNKYGFESEEASYTFVVKPPFYRSLIAYIIYAFVLVLLVLLLRYFRIRKIESEKRIIEQQKHQEMEERRKSYEEEQLKAKQRITTLMNERLEQDLMHKSRELTNLTFNLLRKNEMLQGMKSRMQQLYLEKNLRKRDQEILGLMKQIEKEINTKKDWEIFDLHFNAVHEDFLNKLRKQYPGLNQNDQRLCTFLKMNKTTKEIATLMNMSVRGVETSRYRLRKKMGLPRTENLYEVISGM